MHLLNKLERRLGRHTISGLTKYIIICYVIGYAIYAFAPNAMDYLTLEPALILKGQIWRLVTWLIVAPGSFDIFTIIMLFFYYSIGTNLEQTWGEFRYNIYVFSGILFTVIGAFILYLVYYLMGYSVSIGYAFSTIYISMSLFLAYAATYPNNQVLLYFIIPLKVKWLGIVYGIYIIYGFIRANWSGRVVIFVSLLNFLIFFLANRDYKRVSPKEVKRRRDFRQAVHTAETPGITKHKCAVCGRTELDDPDLEFRFCSKCDGNYEYCQDHLYNHEHVHSGTVQH